MVLASGFTDMVGCYKNNDLYDGGYYYAELENKQSLYLFSTALGGLKPFQKARITYKGRSVIARKGDIGKGGKQHPKIDLHKTLCTALGIPNPNQFLEKVGFELID